MSTSHKATLQSWAPRRRGWMRSSPRGRVLRSSLIEPGATATLRRQDVLARDGRHASGAGKIDHTSADRRQLAPRIGCVELGHLAYDPARPNDRVAPARHSGRRATSGRAPTRRSASLLAGDPVAAGEVVAAPSADKLDAIAVCLLDVSAETQAARLARRGDDPQLFVHHHAVLPGARPCPGPAVHAARSEHERMGGDVLAAPHGHRPGQRRMGHARDR
jgi:hypothetical protein